MPLTSAYLIVSHGSRDPRSQIAVDRLANLVRQQLEARDHPQQSLSSCQWLCGFDGDEKASSATAVLSRAPAPLVATATLEATPMPLHERIGQFARQAESLGLERLQVLPLFLLPGVHVKEDIPREVAIAKQTITNAISLELRPYFGSHPGLIGLLARKFTQLPTSSRILLSHGSRRLGGNAPIEAIAEQLKAIPAYWSVTPSLLEQVTALATSSKSQRIEILPYFLFNGGITEAIARQVQQLQQAFPHLTLGLDEPLGATPELARLIVEGIES